jgi:hypothetical protein
MSDADSVSRASLLNEEELAEILGFELCGDGWCDIHAAEGIEGRLLCPVGLEIVRAAEAGIAFARQTIALNLKESAEAVVSETHKDVLLITADAILEWQVSEEEGNAEVVGMRKLLRNGWEIIKRATWAPEGWPDPNLDLRTLTDSELRWVTAADSWQESVFSVIPD